MVNIRLFHVHLSLTCTQMAFCGKIWKINVNLVNIEGVDVNIKGILKCTVRYLFGIKI
jgi:hypothetical protein